jgi:hypothetical protein
MNIATEKLVDILAAESEAGEPYPTTHPVIVRGDDGTPRTFQQPYTPQEFGLVVRSALGLSDEDVSIFHADGYATDPFYRAALREFVQGVDWGVALDAQTRLAAGANCWDCGEPDEDSMGFDLCRKCKATICDDCQLHHDCGTARVF